ncbi:MAG: preprotein translocase subunit YajC [Clostridia bacterium]|nr:preprotein translocase subunit YajC [Clostridia bacterium]
MNIFNLLLTNGTTDGTTQQLGWESWILPIGMIVILVVFMFISARSNKKKQQEATKMLNSIAIGDDVTTAGGIEGKVVRIKDDHITIESGRDRTKICIGRAYIVSVNKKEQNQ